MFGHPGRSGCNCQGSQRTSCSRHRCRFPASAPWSGPMLADRMRTGDGAAARQEEVELGWQGKQNPTPAGRALAQQLRSCSPPGLPSPPLLPAWLQVWSLTVISALRCGGWHSHSQPACGSRWGTVLGQPGACHVHPVSGPSSSHQCRRTRSLRPSSPRQPSHQPSP